MRSILLLVSILTIFSYSGDAQVYIPITQTSGTQTFSGQDVTITSAGSVAATGMWKECNANPFWIGANYNTIPGSYTFAFSFAVTRVRLHLSAVNLGGINSFYINGAHYPLTAANLDSLKTCDTTYYHQVTTNANGDVVYIGPTVASSYFGTFGAGIVNINYPGGIDSIRFHNNGVEGGAAFSFAFYGFYAAANNDSACYGDTLKLFAKPDISGQPAPVYSWTGPNGFTSNEQNPQIPNSSGIHEGLYIVKIQYGINQAIDTTIVKLRPVPSAPTITTTTPACKGSIVRINGSSKDAGVDYIWTGPGGYGSKQQNESIRNFQERDTGDYYLITMLNGCTSVSAKVKMNIAYPTIGDTITSSICKGGSYDFFGKTITQEGIYEHLLPNSNSNGCDSTTYLQLQIEIIQPDTIRESICQGAGFLFNGKEIKKAGFYQETLKSISRCDSTIVLHLNVEPPVTDTIHAQICLGETYFFNGKKRTQAGIYTDTLKTPQLCDSIVVLQLSIRPAPSITVDYTLNEDPCIGDSVLITANGAEKYIWQVNNISFGEGSRKNVALDQATNQIIIYGTDQFNCAATLAFDILSLPCCNVFIPNAFTPNGDGSNDEFRIYAFGGLSNYQISIFNRWGALMYRGQNIQKSWDGTFQGKHVEPGTYFYQIQATCLTGTTLQKKGDLTLIR